MAEKTWDIGGGDNDYATITALEADAYGGGSGDTVIANCFGTVTEPAKVYFDNNTGITSVTMQSDASEGYDGTEGSGAVIALGITSGVGISGVRTGTVLYFQDLEFNGGGNAYTTGMHYHFNGQIMHMNRCIVRNLSTSLADATDVYVINSSGSTSQFYIYNNIITDAVLAGEGSGNLYGVHFGNAATTKVYNNTVRLIDNQNSGGGDAYGIGINDDADHDYQNNLVSDITSSSGSALDYEEAGAAPDIANATFTTNTSEDATGNDQESASFTADHFLSSDLTNAGADLGGSPYKEDITGTDRDLEAHWDRGAYQFVAAGGGISIPVAWHHIHRHRKPLESLESLESLEIAT